MRSGTWPAVPPPGDVGRRALVAALAASAVRPRAAPAQPDWPQRPVTIVVPFPAGGTADSVPRAVVDGLRQAWRQPVIVDNRPGAGGNIGTAHVANAAPDGHTLLAAPPPPLVINQHLYARLPFDPAQLKAVTILATSPNVVEVSAKLGVRSLSELVALAKARPGAVNVANQGIGTTSHLTAAMFEAAAEVRFNHVPYNGSAPALNDLIAGHVDAFFDNISSSLAHHLAGATRILAICAAERAPQLPDVPTVAEAGVPGFSALAWYAVVAPRGTPDPIIARINADLVSLVRTPEVQKRFADQGATPVGNTPEEAAAFIASETRLWGEVVRRTNLTPGR
jgi:tripartite-type tricarboxylate transporter receptor subunit TctC